MATGKLRQGRARFGADVRERARKYFEEQQRKKEAPSAREKGAGVEVFPVKPPSKIKGRELSDASFKTDLEDRMGMRRGTLERKQYEAKNGGKVKKMAKGGYVKKADGCAQRGKTKGRMI